MDSLEFLHNQLLGNKYFDYRHLTIVDPRAKLKLREATTDKIKRVVMHCTDAPSWSPQRLSSYFVDERKFPICAYHFYIMSDHIYHMVDENVITYHAAPYNSNSVAFSVDFFATNYERNNIVIDPQVYQNAVNTATYLCLKYLVEPKLLVGHRELQFTGWVWSKNHDRKELIKICPGLSIDLDVFRYNVTRRIQETLIEYAKLLTLKSPVVVDGIFGPITRKVFENFPIA
jgi:hypothetical protein